MSKNQTSLSPLSEILIAQNPAALVIGITSFESMTRKDASGYAASLAKSVTKLRQKNVPVIWGVIGHGGNKLIIPQSPTDIRPHDFNLLMEMGFDETGGHGDNRDIHLKFLTKFGPRKNEVIYRKPTKDTLAHPDDAEIFGPAYKKKLLAEAGVKPESLRLPTDPPTMRYIHDDGVDSEFMKFFNNPTLADFLSQRNVKNIMVMGAMSNFCVTETGISSALKNYDTTIIMDRVLSWDRPLTTFAERQEASMVWKDPKSPVNHAANIRDKLNFLIQDSIRSFTPAQKVQIENIHLQCFDDFMARLTPIQQQQTRHTQSRTQLDATYNRFLDAFNRTNPPDLPGGLNIPGSVGLADQQAVHKPKL